MKCLRNCCELKIIPYIGYPDEHSYEYNNKEVNYKAGVLFYDPKKKKVLLVQSRGYKWGFPKGSMEDCDNNDVYECAKREVYEETGIILNRNQLNRKYIFDSTTYFYLECDEMPVSVQNMHNYNDANGITWMKIDCLKEMIKCKLMEINYPCKKLLKHFLKFNTVYK